MLIPFLHENPRKAAQLVPNGYVNKLVQECYQMFMGAIWHLGPKLTKGPAYCNHPFTKWVASSSWAWDWLFNFAQELATVEYPKRYPEKQDKRKKSYHIFWYKIAELEKPTNFSVTTKEETMLCPLPKAIKKPKGINHHERALEFRHYLKKFKNKNKWQFFVGAANQTTEMDG